MKSFIRIILTLTLLLLASGCSMTWRAEWPVAAPDQPTAASNEMLNRAENEFATARDADGVRRAIASYQQVLTENPADYKALTRLSTLHILLGTAYTKGRSEQSDRFHQAMKYAEQAMYTNADFRAAVADGTPPWDAVGSLTAREVEAMFFWVTAVQYDFKDGMSLPAKVVNIGWLQHCQKMLDRIEAVAPEFGGGGVEFARVICYYALPESMGGSEAKGDEYMAKAVARGDRDGWLLPRWARGKYYYEILDQTKLQRQDLEWVVSQDPATMHDPFPWRVHFQENARELL